MSTLGGNTTNDDDDSDVSTTGRSSPTIAGATANITAVMLYKLLWLKILHLNLFTVTLSYFSCWLKKRMQAYC